MNEITTELSQRIGIQYPIIAAPMFLVSYPDLVVAASEAGALGTFPALNYRTIVELKQGLKEITDRTSKPIGVNVVVHPRENPDWQKQMYAALDAGVKVIITCKS